MRSRNGYFWVALILASVLIIYVYVTANAIWSGKYTFEEYFVVYGDSFSALLTSFSLFGLLYQMKNAESQRKEANTEANKDRRLSVQLNYLEAKIQSLDKQMMFYSKLKGMILQCWIYDDGKVIHLTSDFKSRLSERDILIEYEYLAKEQLKEILRDYNTVHRIANISPGTTALVEFKKMMDTIKTQVDTDMKELQEEYHKTFKELQSLMDWFSKQ